MSWGHEARDVERPDHWIPKDAGPGIPTRPKSPFYRAVCGERAQPYGPCPPPSEELRCLECLRLAGDEIAAYEKGLEGMVFA